VEHKLKGALEFLGIKTELTELWEVMAELFKV
jgi:hypothetical protein